MKAQKGKHLAQVSKQEELQFKPNPHSKARALFTATTLPLQLAFFSQCKSQG